MIAVSSPGRRSPFPSLFDLDGYEFFDVEEEVLGFDRDAGIPVFSLCSR